MNITLKIHEFSSINSMKTCLKKGMGITLCPDISIREECARGELQRLNCSLEQPETPVLMIRNGQKWCSPILKRFLTLVEKFISDNPED
jgi:DNA-binding transcriptional LysR family regulator